MICVSVAYVSPQMHYYQELWVSQGSTIYDVIQLCGCLDVPELLWFGQWCQDNHKQDPNHRAWHVGIYSVKKCLDTLLQDGDRIEIYRALSYDPMTRRKSKSTAGVKKLQNAKIDKTKSIH